MNSFKNYFSIKNFIGFTISLICIYWSFINFNFNEFYTYSKSINYYYFFLAIFLLIITVFIRSLRWSLFFDSSKTKSFNVYSLFKNEMIGYFGNNIFPLKLGDLLRVSIMSKQTKISKTYLLGTIVLERFIDMISLFLFTLLFICFFWQEFATSYVFFQDRLVVFEYGFIFVILISVALIIAYLLIKNKQGLVKINLFFSSIKNIKNSKSIFKIILESLFIWLIYLMNVTLISYSCGYDFSIFQSVVLLVSITVAMIIPSAPGMIGTFEVAVTSVMLSDLFNFDSQDATSFSIILHAYSYISYSIIGGYYFFKSNIKHDN